MKETELLFDLLKKGVSPVQAVRACKERLESAGFLELPYDEPWEAAEKRKILCKSS